MIHEYMDAMKEGNEIALSKSIENSKASDLCVKTWNLYRLEGSIH